MYEFFIAFKYLIPKKKALSTALISLMSIFVISLVVWLVLVFLSVTTGIEKNWLKKLTSLNAPLRITPTNAYYNSYYYQIDAISSNSNYTHKTIKEKLNAPFANPYSLDNDMEIPAVWPNPTYAKNGQLLDPVKSMFKILNLQKNKYSKLAFEDFEVSGALMKLSLHRSIKNNSLFPKQKLSFISQISYLLSFAQNNPNFSSLCLKPDSNDLNNLIQHLNISQKNLLCFFENVEIKKIMTEQGFYFPLSSVVTDIPFEVYVDNITTSSNTPINKLILILNKDKNYTEAKKGTITLDKNNNFVFTTGNVSYGVSKNCLISFVCPTILECSLIKDSLSTAQKIEDIKFEINIKIQNKLIKSIIPYQNINLFDVIAKTTFSSTPQNVPLWPYEIKNKITSKMFLPSTDQSVVLPKALKNNGVLIGDRGYFAYSAKTATTTQEHRLPIVVSGFYDPGIFSIGNRCIIADSTITNIISSSDEFALENIPTNGINIWTNLDKANQLKLDIKNEMIKNKIDPFWKIETYKEYEFSKDLLQQFQSDRLLFTLIAIIIIVVACSNIISLLILLVNNKKKEIATLQAMGATKKSIALIFGFCGIFMGILSSFIGTIAAIFTLKHLDVLVNFLSFIQGHDAFNAAFFGDKLPSALSFNALMFVLIITPIISLVAGLIPAMKAAKLHPSKILRTD